MGRPKHIAIRNYEKFIEKNKFEFLKKWIDFPSEIKKAIKWVKLEIIDHPDRHDGTDGYFKELINQFCQDIIDKKLTEDHFKKKPASSLFYSNQKPTPLSAENAKKTDEKETINPCVVCGDELGDDRRKKYCSHKCRNTARTKPQKKNDEKPKESHEAIVYCSECGSAPSSDNPIYSKDNLCSKCRENKGPLFDIEKSKMTPKGIKPQTVRNWERIVEILEGIDRYINAQLPIPVQWVIEYNELITKI